MLSVLLAAAVALTYASAPHCEFVNIDDPTYVTHNDKLRLGIGWDSLRWGLTTFYFANWHPLVWWSYLLDYQLHGLDARGFHVTNLAWHLASTLMLFVALRRLTGDVWPSALAAALFAVHPLNVQSVAWVSERKGVISTFFWMLTLWAYARYAERPGWGRYLLVLVSLAVGLMAKQMLVTLPCVLLLLDYWPLERRAPWRRLLLEKLPLLLLATAASVLTVLAQRAAGAVAELENLSLTVRLGNALVSYVAYLGQALLPINLAAHYPHPGDTLRLWQPLAAAALLAGVTFVVVRQARRWPHALVGWLWYIGTLVPVIGLVQVGSQARADRYAYVPLVGIFIALSWSLASLARHWSPRWLIPAVAAALAGLLLTSRAQVDCWRNSLVLWQQALRNAGPSSLAHNNLGTALLPLDRQAAAREFQRALRSNDRDPRAHNNLGSVLMAHDRAAARRHFEVALSIEPNYAGAHVNLGTVLAEQGDLVAAAASFRKALGIDPHILEAHINLGLLALRRDEPGAAAQHFLDALARAPDHAGILLNLGTALLEQGKVAEALDHFEAVAQRLPDHPGAHFNRGVAHALQDRPHEAVAALRQASTLAPTMASAQRELADALDRLGDKPGAEAAYRESLRLDPGWPQALTRLAWSLATHPEPGRRNGARAVRLARQACQATRERDPTALDVLAAALAETGRLDAAAAMARTAAALARAAHRSEQADEIDARRRLYEQGMAYRAGAD